jgi:predicted ATPase/class 3 adenylate cyclase
LLPAGTITFLFTDIEGSTRLWEQHPEAMKVAHARHVAIVAEFVRQHGGTLVRERGEGDSCFAVFSQATAAVAAVTAIQRALVDEPWPEEAAIRARAAMHTGEAPLREGDYNSSAVNRCARLRALAAGGQTLLSRSTYELARDDLPEGVSLKDLGLHRLKDLQRPEHVFQIVHPALPPDFPPLRSLDVLPTNLPQQLTRFIGREREIDAVKGLLADTRLLTLTGTGGMGKTRLALQVGAEVLEAYPDGVWLIELAALSDAGVVPQQVAAALGVREEPGRPLPDTLIDALRPKRLLLILDNCEHLVEASASLAHALLRGCPELHVLATSRAALGLVGETIWRVPSLAAPDPHQHETVEQLTQYLAVQLFIDRARESRPGFKVTNATAPAVAQLCYRLDGIPLAIELAAARVRALSVEQLMERLDDRFRLLTGGSRTALPRQQTLRAALDWSFDLLSDQERALLRRVSVFAGGWTLEAAEAVCGGVGEWEEGLDLLTALVEKSLVGFEEPGGEARYRLLETIRQYAHERLVESAEVEALQDRHQQYYLRLAEAAEPQLTGPDQTRWLARLEADHDNLRAAFDRTTAGNGGEAALRLAVALWRFWYVRGYSSEGRERLALVLSKAVAVDPTASRAKALNGAGALAFLQGDYGAARSLYEESLAIWRALGERQGIAASLGNLGLLAHRQANFAAARTLHEESLAIRRELGSPQGIAASLSSLGLVADSQGDSAAARALHEESLAIRRELGDRLGIAICLNNLGNVAQAEGEYPAARALYEESLAIKRELGDRRGIATSLNNMGNVANEQGEYLAARALFEESLAIRRELGDQLGAAESLEGLGELARATGRPARAIRLWGATSAVRERIGAPLTPEEHADQERLLAAARAALGEEAFAAAWAAGRAMPLEQAIAAALEATGDP